MIEPSPAPSFDRRTGLSLLGDVLLDSTRHDDEYHDQNVVNVPAQHVQCDEIWSFAGAKAKNVRPDKQAQG